MKLLLVQDHTGNVTDLYRIKEDKTDLWLAHFGFEAVDDADNVPGVEMVCRNKDGETAIVLDLPARAPIIMVPFVKE